MPGRRALYLTFVPPLTFEMVGPGQGYNDVLFARDDGHIQHVDQLGERGKRPSLTTGFQHATCRAWLTVGYALQPTRA